MSDVERISALELLDRLGRRNLWRLGIVAEVAEPPPRAHGSPPGSGDRPIVGLTLEVRLGIDGRWVDRELVAACPLQGGRLADGTAVPDLTVESAAAWIVERLGSRLAP